MADYSDDDDVRASFSEDDENPYSHKGYGGHSGGSRRYKLPRRSETYSSNLGSRRSGGERFHRTPSYDLDEYFDSGMQLSRSGGTSLSRRGNGHFGREAPSRRPTYPPEAEYYDGDYGPGYSPYKERYPQDIGYVPRRHASGDIFIHNSNVKFVSEERPIHIHSPYNEAVARQKEGSSRKRREASRNVPPPPVEKSVKSRTKDLMPLILPPLFDNMFNRAFNHRHKNP